MQYTAAICQIQFLKLNLQNWIYKIEFPKFEFPKLESIKANESVWVASVPQKCFKSEEDTASDNKWIFQEHIGVSNYFLFN